MGAGRPQGVSPQDARNRFERRIEWRIEHRVAGPGQRGYDKTQED